MCALQCLPAPVSSAEVLGQMPLYTLQLSCLYLIMLSRVLGAMPQLQHMCQGPLIHV